MDFLCELFCSLISNFFLIALGELIWDSDKSSTGFGIWFVRITIAIAIILLIVILVYSLIRI